jgi:hypothetical protein
MSDIDDLIARLERGHDDWCAMRQCTHEASCDCDFVERAEAAAALREQAQEIERLIVHGRGDALSFKCASEARYFWQQRAERAEAERDAARAEAEALRKDAERIAPVLGALRRFDWVQVILNRAAPCCQIEPDGSFCGGAEAWDGHKYYHPFKSLDEAIDAAERGES